MHEFQSKKIRRPFFYSNVFFAIVVILGAVLIRGLWGVYHKYTIANSRFEEAFQHQQALVESYDKLEREVARLETPEGVEAEIRTNFRMAKENEKLIVVVEDGISKEEADKPAPSIWQKIRGWIGLD
ncbi:MAG: hypothetical protein A2928_02055 [Candidatus Taylorbacteria bacterium RIFCSPLOWO2_01_FULL_45_15b]|uniref:Uncharacterized protein n=1 Tax=Candidatus Taylorbacteria bacterium RIFCSPLOWO2_01_FULL_45_15b TaxID=1802319 RepID=A0A1G2N6Z1_9BACT|nr:MAG: hypothetical protein A2928_02055 [Candidatus Taylorbacteria bacterium RIFCSPLOWO2_01_FULL_45_15b]